MRLDINYKKNTVKNTNTRRLNNTFLNNQHVPEEIKRETKIFLETNDNENTTQNLWDEAKAVLREVYSNTIQSQETRKTTNNLTLYLKQLKKEQQQQQQQKNKISRRK